MTATIGWWAELFTEPTPASLSVTGGTPTVSTTQNRLVQPAAAALAITGGTPTPGDLLIRPGAASIALAGGTPTVNVGTLLTPAGASLTATGGTPGVVRGNVLKPSGASLAVTGGTPTVTVTAPVAFDSTGVGSAAQTSSLTWSHTIGSQANCCIVAVHSGDVALSGISAKVGATSMTMLGTSYQYDTNKYLTLFRLLNPPTGSQTITVTFTGGTPFANGDSVTYRNVGGFGTTVTNTGTGTSASQSVSSGTGQMVVNLLGNVAGSGGGFTGYTQTSRYSTANVPSAGYPTLIGDAAGASTVNFGATLPSSLKWGSIAVPLLTA